MIFKDKKISSLGGALLLICGLSGLILFGGSDISLRGFSLLLIGASLIMLALSWPTRKDYEEEAQ